MAKRKKWSEPVSFERNSPIWELAKKASAESDSGDSIGDLLCASGASFDDVLDVLVGNGVVTKDLSETERAFCAGWAYGASRTFPLTDDGRKNRRDAIKAHLGDGGPGFFSEGEDKVEMLGA